MICDADAGIVTDATLDPSPDTGTGDSGNKLTPKSNTTDNMMKMIIDLLSLMIALSSFLGNSINNCHFLSVPPLSVHSCL